MKRVANTLSCTVVSSRDRGADTIISSSTRASRQVIRPALYRLYGTSTYGTYRLRYRTGTATAVAVLQGVGRTKFSILLNLVRVNFKKYYDFNRIYRI
eukprot:SAG31_NODE_12978_length_901_cov_1.417186_1_plen_98_part_00